MLKENKLVSFFISLKNKINSFISNATFSSKKFKSKFNQISGNNYSNSNINIKNTYMKYLISKKIQRNSQISNPINMPKMKNIFQHNSSHEHINDFDDNSISTSASNFMEYNYYGNNGINLKEDNILNENNCNNYINCNMKITSKKRRNDSSEKNMNKNIFKNGNLIGQKHLRDSLLFNDEDENENKDEILDGEKNSMNCNYESGHLTIVNETDDAGDVDDKIAQNKLTESKKNKDNKFKRKSIDRIKKDIIDKRNKNEKEIIRLNSEFHSFKEKMKQKDKINELFKCRLNLKKFKSNTINENTQIEAKKINSNLNDKAVAHVFKHLRYTHPQRFSFDSVINKKKRKLSNSSSLLISVENNINIISTCKKKKEESFNGEFNMAKINAQEIKENNCEINKAFGNENRIINESIGKMKNDDVKEKDKVIKDNNPLSITNPLFNSLSKSKQSEDSKKAFNFNNLLNQNNNNIKINVNDNIQNNTFISNIIQDNNNNNCYNINMKGENSRNNNELVEMDLDEDNNINIGHNESKHKMFNKYLLNNNNSYKNPFLIENEKYNSKKDNYQKSNFKSVNNIFGTLKNENSMSKSNNIFENKNNGNSIFSVKKEKGIINHSSFFQMNNSIGKKNNFSNIKFSFGKK